MNLALEVWHDERVTRGPGPTCEDDEGGRDALLRSTSKLHKIALK